MLGTANLLMGSSSAAMAIPTQSIAVKYLASTKINSQSFNCRTLSLSSGLVSSAFNSSSCFLSSRRFFRSDTGINVVNSDQLVSSDSIEQEANNKYYFLVANAKFMLDEEEHFQEQLFERLRYYGERSMEQDFWLVVEPKFLDKFPNITKRLQRPAVALVSTNGTWITFMKLRLDRVLADSFEAASLEEALASNPTKLEFEKPEKWVAPYPKYESGWWETFLPQFSKTEAKV